MRRSILLVLFVSACGGVPAAPGAPDLAQPSSARLTLSAFSVPAGQERYVCQDFANPFGGSDASIARFDSHLSSGGHHLLVFFKTGASDGALEDCSGSEFAAGPYGSQRLDDTLSYPSGVAARIPAADGFRVQAHFLNATAQPIDAAVQITMTVAAGGGIVDPAAVLFFTNTDLHVPASATGVVQEKTCTLPFDVKLLQATGHMHRHGVDFHAKTPTATLFDSTAWSDVQPALFDPPLAISAGTAITFSCTYDNDTATPIVYGPSAQTDEMCIFSAQFYPAPFGGWSCL